MRGRWTGRCGRTDGRSDDLGQDFGDSRAGIVQPAWLARDRARSRAGVAVSVRIERKAVRGRCGGLGVERELEVMEVVGGVVPAVVR